MSEATMIDAALLARARAQSLHTQRPLLAELELLSGLDARLIVRTGTPVGSAP